MLAQKKILLGVCGSIAAYKAALIVRLLVKKGAEVKVIMTASASDFITPLTLSTLSKNPVLTDFVADKTGQWNNHVELGLWADLMLIAPASANTMAAAAGGLCNNLLLATYLSARCPVAFAPAMDLDMYQHPATKANLEKLSTYGDLVIPAETGELASGLEGQGRMAEPEAIIDFLESYFSKKKAPLAAKKILVTAGPTYEALDPVRFIGNHSSGKMGYAIAEQLADAGAQVELVSGPVQLSTVHPNITITRVNSAQEMHNAAVALFPDMDIAVLAAAVADYRPKQIADQKIKKKESELSIELEKTPDIAFELGKLKSKTQTIVGFALETNDEESNALSKLQKKNFDIIVLNSLQDKGAGFGHNTNKITLYHKNGSKQVGELKTKKEVAHDIVEAIIDHLRN